MQRVPHFASPPPLPGAVGRGLGGKETWKFQASGQRVGSRRLERTAAGGGRAAGAGHAASQGLPGAWTPRGSGAVWRLVLTELLGLDPLGGACERSSFSWHQSRVLSAWGPVALARCYLVWCSGGREGRGWWAKENISNNQRPQCLLSTYCVSGVRDVICPLTANR